MENNYYAIGNLHKFEPDIESIRWNIPINASKLTSTPTFIFTQTEWVILMVQDGRVVIYDQMSPESMNQNVTLGIGLRLVPDISLYNSQSEILDPIPLPKLITNPVDQQGFSILF